MYTADFGALLDLSSGVDTVPDNSSSTIRVLIADDEAEIRELAARSLTKLGIRSDKAENGEIALALMRDIPFDALISDLRMPKMNGHELVRHALEEKLVPIIVVVTGIHEPKLAADLISRGVTAVENKPIDYNVLAAMIQAYVNRSARQAVAPAKEEPALGENLGELRNKLRFVQQQLNETLDVIEREKARAEQGFFDAIRVFSETMAKTGHFSGSHATRVERLASYIAERAALHPTEKRSLSVAALMHDVGQFGMPGDITAKPPHTMLPNEKEIFFTYPNLSALILDQTQTGHEVARIIRAHREDFDGTGFPNGLKGDKIPIAARVLRIADSIDNAMAHAQSDPREIALRSLSTHAGTKYDPDLVDYARDYIQNESVIPSEALGECLPADLVPGMILAKNVFDNSGQFMAKEGTVLTLRLIERFREILPKTQIGVYSGDESNDKE